MFLLTLGIQNSNMKTSALWRWVENEHNNLVTHHVPFTRDDNLHICLNNFIPLKYPCFPPLPRQPLTPSFFPSFLPSSPPSVPLSFPLQLNRGFPLAFCNLTCGLYDCVQFISAPYCHVSSNFLRF